MVRNWVAMGVVSAAAAVLLAASPGRPRLTHADLK